MYAGSYVIRPKSSSSTLISRRAGARIVPSSIGISYVLPVRLSVTLSVSDAVATPPPFVLSSSVAMTQSWHPARSGGDDGAGHRADDEQHADRHDAALRGDRPRERR